MPAQADNETAEQRARQIVDQMMARDAFSRWLGIEVLEVTPGRAVVRMTVRPEMLNGFAVAHGGIAFALADSALAFASNTCGMVTMTLESSIFFATPVRAGDVLTATAEETSAGNRVALYDVVVTRADGTRVAFVRGTAYRTKQAHD
ncbi:PaaI family thioesterase [Rhodothermus marinus]|uniref:Thioesterase superfamily protein n=1 Tax=Rhodothermus marinus (strain ATCC 43812 / DSM 4252 / R-10) TaxID=518766 RepID=D0MIY2_RHOM4|nr:hotdog fold thioesterase [Rhodothermus marinus]ACY48440.1 thioesterase superfamily protein [Rhodothermus marinus DSM 4252]